MNPQVIKEIQSLNERVSRVESVLDTTRERLTECKHLNKAEEALERGSVEGRDPFAALGEGQRALLETRLAEK